MDPRRFPAVVALLLVACLALSGCDGSAEAHPDPETTTTSPTTTTTTTTTPPTTTTTSTTTTTTTVPVFDLNGVVTTPAGAPLPGAVVTVNDAVVTTDGAGAFAVPAVPMGTVAVERPGWLAETVEWDGSLARLTVTLQPRTVRAIRAVYGWVDDDESFAAILDLAAGSTVNALVFDTKDEAGTVPYDTGVAEAHAIGAVDVAYDPAARIAAARDAGLYTITRIAVFEDPVRARVRPEAKLAGSWIDMTDPANWEYPLALATEACELGFDEIQFDYVRFPAGRTAEVARQRMPTTEEQRVAAIVAFLTEARARLLPMGCATSADVFAIVLSTRDDQGIGQRPEEISAVVDALSPMVYPSHYSPGWIGLSDPNDHPATVTGDALDAGMPRLAPTAAMRPWLQAFSWSSQQILAAIEAAESRGTGWILWNAGGNYRAASLPASPASG